MKTKSIHQEYVTLVNIHAPIIRAPKYVKQILTDLKGEKDNTVNSRGPLYPTFNKTEIVQTENQ